MSSTPIRTLLVGSGKMGESHFHHIKESDVAECVGLVTLDEITDFCKSPFRDLEDALKATNPDLVVIATPHNLHYEQTKLALSRGCHVVVEKPLSLFYDEAEQLVDLAKQKGKLLVVGLQRRYEGFWILGGDQ